MIFDTHTHCYWETLEPRIKDIVDNMHAQGVVHAVQIGCDIPTSKKAIHLAHEFPGVFYATVGLHPETAQDMDIHDSEGNAHRILEEMELLIQAHRDVIVAIGECGLDFHYLDGTANGTKPIDHYDLSSKAQDQIENQKYWWHAQWQLAQKYHLPLVIHTRDARDATLDFIKQEGIHHAVMHCYSEDPDFARELLDFSDNIYFSFSGILTYKNAQKVQNTAQILPMDRILVETDAPFLTPQPVRGQVCEPSFTRYTLQKLAELRGGEFDTIAPHIFENSLRFFALK